MNTGVKVKICGIRRKEEIDFINSCLPDYIGFIFAESRRRVSPEQVRELSRGLDGSVKKVGVFVNESSRRIIEIAGYCGLDALQLHGDESGEYVKEIKKLGFEVWKAVRVKDEESLEGIDRHFADVLVLDSFVPGSYGGAGISFDWKIAAGISKNIKIFLAGGLNPVNVADAVKMVKPYGVDTSSGVETDGWKDGDKIREFVGNAKRSVKGNL